MFLAEVSDVQWLWLNFGFAGVVLSALCFVAGYLFKLWIKSKEHIHLEELKQLTKRDEIKFSKLHEKRAEIVKELYDKILVCNDLVRLFAQNRTSKEQQQMFIEEMVKTETYFQQHRIYFSETVCTILDTLKDQWDELGADVFFADIAFPNKKLSESETTSQLVKKIKTTLGGITKQLEIEFRQMLGVEE